MERNKEENYPAFKALRNIDLNLLTIFEAVYVHKGIVNAARVLNLTPSAISQSIQKLRTTFPDPLFIRKGQGVAPTAYAAYLHEYISQGLSSILGALDINNTYDKERTITLATTPTVGAILMPRIYSAMQKVNPKLSIRNVPAKDTESILSQFQADIAINSQTHYSNGICSHKLYDDTLVLACRHGHPATTSIVTDDDIQNMNSTLLLMQDDQIKDLRQVINDTVPNRHIAFSSYNFLTIASMLNSSDMMGFMPRKFFEMFAPLLHLQTIECNIFSTTKIPTMLHVNKLSSRDAVLQEVVEAVLSEFQSA